MPPSVQKYFNNSTADKQKQFLGAWRNYRSPGDIPDDGQTEKGKKESISEEKV